MNLLNQLVTLLGKGAAIVRTRAEIATLDTVTFANLYFTIGKAVAAANTPLGDLEAIRSRIHDLEKQAASVAYKNESPQNAKAERGVAIAVKAFAAKASKVASDATAAAQLTVAYTQLGRAAVDKYGDKVVPKAILPDFDLASLRRAQVLRELAVLEQHAPYGWITVKRVAIMGTCSLVVLLAWAWLDAVKSESATRNVIVGPALVERGHARSGPTHDAISPAGDGNNHIVPVTTSSATRTGSRSTQVRDRDFLVRSNSSYEDWQRERTRLEEDLEKAPVLLALPYPQMPDNRPWFSEASKGSLALRNKAFALNKMLIASQKDLADSLSANTDLSDRDVTLAADRYSKQCQESVKQLQDLRDEELRRVKAWAEEFDRNVRQLADRLRRHCDRQLSIWKSESEKLLAPLADDPAIQDFSSVLKQQDFRKVLSDRDAALRDIYTGHDDKVRDGHESLNRKLLTQVRGNTAVKNVEIAESLMQEMDSAISAGLNELKTERARSLANMVVSAKSRNDSLAMQQSQAERFQPRAITVPANASDADIAVLAREAPETTSLDLSQCSRLTEACCESIGQMSRLRRLAFPAAVAVSPQAFSKLRHLRLDSLLNVPKSLVDNPESLGVYLRMHRELPQQLNDIDLEYGDRGLMQYEGMQVEALVLPLQGITDDGLRSVPKIRGLKSLTIYMTKDITNTGLSFVRNCTTLQSLSLEDASTATRRPVDKTRSSVTEQGIAALAGLDLDNLKVPEWLQTDKCLRHYINALGENARGRQQVIFQSQKEWHRMHWPLTEESVQALRGQRGIRFVEINGYDDAKHVDKCLPPMWSCPDLETVAFNHVQLRGEGLADVAKAKKLKQVSFIVPKVMTNVALESLGASDSLTEVFISDAPDVTGEGVLALGRCKSLRKVYVRETKARIGDGIRLERVLDGCRVVIE